MLEVEREDSKKSGKATGEQASEQEQNDQQEEKSWTELQLGGGRCGSFC